MGRPVLSAGPFLVHESTKLNVCGPYTSIAARDPHPDDADSHRNHVEPRLTAALFKFKPMNDRLCCACRHHRLQRDPARGFYARPACRGDIPASSAVPSLHVGQQLLAEHRGMRRFASHPFFHGIRTRLGCFHGGNRKAGGRGPVFDSELRVNLLQMFVDGSRAQAENCRDVPVGFAARDP